MFNTNKALAVLHNSDLFSMKPQLHSSFKSYELQERGALPRYDITYLVLYHQTQTLNALLKAVIPQLDY